MNTDRAQLQMFAAEVHKSDRSESTYVRPGTRWKHHSGRFYRVMMVVNVHATDRSRYPLLVVYMDEQQRTWCKPMDRFLNSMRLEG
jgi:hypothetical protein